MDYNPFIEQLRKFDSYFVIKYGEKESHLFISSLTLVELLLHIDKVFIPNILLDSVSLTIDEKLSNGTIEELFSLQEYEHIELPLTRSIDFRDEEILFSVQFK